MTHPSRREFVASSASMFGGGWLWLHLPAIAALSACARDAAQQNDPFTNLSAEQGRTMRAFASRIIPSGDGLPGADEAGAAWFVDGALGTPSFAGAQPLVASGLEDLNSRAQAAHAKHFADVTPEEQDALMQAVEQTPFFFVARMLTIGGTFSDSSLGGNRDHAGFQLLQIEHAPAYQPPFGWYDEEYIRSGGASADGAP